MTNFPRYKDFDPKVPVWCVTPNRPACIHRFFDTSPISPSGRYLAVLQLPFEDRQPLPGEAASVCIVDLETGKDRVVAETYGWEPQLGANINWGGSDHELFFNDVDLQTWRPFAWKLDPLTGKRERMEGTVYHASPDGRWLISANMTTMRKTQPGYGVCIPPEKMRRNVGPVEDDGFYLTDTSTGKTRLLVSIAEILKKSNPPVLMDNPEQQEIYGFHGKFNPQGDALMLSIRWFPATDEPRWDMFKIDAAAVRYAWITMNLDGSSMHCAVGPEQWEKRGNHATWFPDGKRISMNLNIDRKGLRLVQVNADGSDLRKMLEDTPGSGHPTVHKNGRYLLTDTYTHEDTSFGDGTVPLRWIDLTTGKEETLVRINTRQLTDDIVMRWMRILPGIAHGVMSPFKASSAEHGGCLSRTCRMSCRTESPPSGSRLISDAQLPRRSASWKIPEEKPRVFFRTNREASVLFPRTPTQGIPWPRWESFSQRFP